MDNSLFRASRGRRTAPSPAGRVEMRCAGLLALVGAVASLAGCGEQTEAAVPPPPMVVVATPVVKDMTSYYRYTGNMAAVEQVEVRARVAGELLSQHFTPSTDVQAGDLLFVIEPAPYEAAVAAAEAEVDRAKAALDLAEVEKQRIDDAFAKDAATEQERLTFAAQVKQRQAELQAAEAQLREANIQLGYTQVKSPIAGRVNRQLVDPGNLVGQGEPTLLTTVVKMDPIHAYFDVSERIVLEYLARGKHGGVGSDAEPPPLEIARANDMDGTYPFTGIVDYVDNVVDNETATIRVRGVFDNPEMLLFPGLFIRVRAPYETTEDATLVQESALGTDLSGDFVLVVGADNTVERRGVTLGDSDEHGLIVVTDGLDPGERYIVEGIQKARPGAPVSVKPSPGAAASGGSQPPADESEPAGEPVAPADTPEPAEG